MSFQKSFPFEDVEISTWFEIPSGTVDLWENINESESDVSDSIITRVTDDTYVPYETKVTIPRLLPTVFEDGSYVLHVTVRGTNLEGVDGGIDIRLSVKNGSTVVFQRESLNNVTPFGYNILEFPFLKAEAELLNNENHDLRIVIEGRQNVAMSERLNLIVAWAQLRITTPPYYDLSESSEKNIIHVVEFSGFVNGVEKIFYVSDSHSGPVTVNGVNENFISGDIDLIIYNAITRRAGDKGPDRSFTPSQSNKSTQRSFNFEVPDSLLSDIIGREFRGGKFRVWGWGSIKIDGSPFPFDEATLLHDGIMKNHRASGDRTLELKWLPDAPDFDIKFQQVVYRGFGGAVGLIIPEQSESQDGTSLVSNTINPSPFATSGNITVEIFWIMRDIDLSTIIEFPLFRVGGGSDFNVTNYALFARPLGKVAFGSNLERIVSNDIVIPSSGFFYTGITIASDGKTIEIMFGKGGSADDIKLITSGVLSIAISPPVFPDQTFIVGPNPFMGVFINPGSHLEMDVLEVRLWSEVRTLDQIKETAERTIREDEVSSIPTLDHLYRMNEGTGIEIINDFGNGTTVNFAFVGFGSITPTFESAFSGSPPDLFAQDVVGQEKPIIFGRVFNVPGHKIDDQRSVYAAGSQIGETPGVTFFEEVNSNGVPLTQNHSLTATFSVNDVTDTWILVTADLSFFPFIQPIGGPGFIPGQKVETLDFVPASLNGEHDVISISEDGQTMIIDPGGPLGQTGNFVGTMRTPTSGANKFQAKMDFQLGAATIDRDTITGKITFNCMNDLGLGFNPKVSDVFRFVATIKERREGFISDTEEITLIISDGMFDSEIGLYLPRGGSLTFETIMNMVMGSVFGYWFRDTNGDYYIGTYREPTGAPALAVSELNQGNCIVSVEELGRIDPYWRYSVTHEENYLIQDEDSLAGAVPPERRDKLGKKSELSWFVDRLVRDSVSTADERDEPISTLIVSKEDAEEYINRTGLLRNDPKFYRIECSNLYAQNFKVDDEVRIVYDSPLLDLSFGKNVIIMNKTTKLKDRTMVLEAYGTELIITYSGQSITYGLEGENDFEVTY